MGKAVQGPLFGRFKSFWGASRRWLVGQRLDSKSKLCPNIVQYTSKVCPIPVKVQGLSSPCPTISTHVQTLSNVCQDPVQTKFFGQTLDAKIQDLSRLCPMKCEERVQYTTVDKLQTNFGLGHSVDKLRCYMFEWTNSGQSSDILWTMFGFGQSLDKVWIWTNYGQS